LPPVNWVSEIHMNKLTKNVLKYMFIVLVIKLFI
jgi:hypothetical protein